MTETKILESIHETREAMSLALKNLTPAERAQKANDGVKEIAAKYGFNFNMVSDLKATPQ